MGRTHDKHTSQAFGRAVALAGISYAVATLLVVALVGGGDVGFTALSFGVASSTAVAGAVLGFTFGVPKLSEDQRLELTPGGTVVLNTNFSRSPTGSPRS